MSTRKLILMIFVISMGYAVLRYNIFGDVPASDIPFYVLNKVLAYGGLLLLGIAGLKSTTSGRHKLGVAAAYCLLIHVVITLTIFSPEYFQKLFEKSSHRLTLPASLSLLCGALAFVCLIHLWRVSINKRKGTDLSLVSGLGRALLILAAGHTAFMGFNIWFSPSTWPGKLPPITLFAFTTAIIFLWVTHKHKRPDA